LNWRLLGDLARRHPEWSFVFVGGTRQHTPMEGIKGLSTCANAYFLGAKAAREMADYAQHFDCCIMPYNESNYTNYIYPMKLHEYLASGRPVVGTPIRTVREYSHVVELARTVDEWSAAIGRALSAPANTPEKRQQRQEIARRHDWDTLAFKIAGIIANGLDEAFPTERELCPRSGEGKT
jgi:glycosyltransferase involved in cell wall biosynthesis